MADLACDRRVFPRVVVVNKAFLDPLFLCGASSLLLASEEGVRELEAQILLSLWHLYCETVEIEFILLSCSPIMDLSQQLDNVFVSVLDSLCCSALSLWRFPADHSDLMLSNSSSSSPSQNMSTLLIDLIGSGLFQPCFTFELVSISWEHLLIWPQFSLF